MSSRLARVEVRSGPLGRGVFATAPVAAGEAVIELPPVFTRSPGRHTIQLDQDRHQAYTGDTDDFLNHSCAPTCHVDVTELTVVTLVPLAAGQELTFNYLTTEWELVDPFECSCDGRRRLIRGFGSLPLAEQLALAPLAAPWLRAAVGQPEAW